METLTTATAQKMKSVLNQSAKQTVNPQKKELKKTKRYFFLWILKHTDFINILFSSFLQSLLHLS